MSGDAQVLVASSTDAGAISRLNGIKTRYLGLTLLQMLLFKSFVPYTPSLTLVGLGDEADYAGYQRATISAFNGPYLDADHNAYMVTPLLDFVCSGGGNTNSIYNAALCGTNGTTATATATATGGAAPIDSVTLTAGGSGYILPPTYTISGGGTGAVLSFTIVDGVITAIAIVDGGDGYTTPTVTIDPPLGLLEVLPLNPVVSLTNATDALPLVAQLQVPAQLV